MQYIGTRGGKTPKNFTDILISSLADKGGLFVPEALPKFSDAQIKDMAKMDYIDLAYAITKPFADDISQPDYRKMLKQAYGTFHHKEITPLTQINDNMWGLELFHGQTLAFKDVALSLLGELSDFVCQKKGVDITIIGATSGDTGPASMSAFAGRKHAKVFMMYPYGKTSDIQRKQMTTLRAENLHALAIKGSFDDCQDIAKALFEYKDLQKHNLAAVNSINWARIMAQITYYAYASLKLGRTIDLAVPTGNFGNILAAYCAKQMGFDIDRLIIASNENDILTRFINDNDMSLKSVTATWSPSIDIQISSNFERMLFWLLDSDAEKCEAIMQDFRKNKKFPKDEALWQKAKQIFSAHRIGNDETLDIIKRLHNDTGELYDPHSAIAIEAGLRCTEKNPVVVALTAHPAKFPEATHKACGIKADLPKDLQGMLEATERTTILEADPKAIADYIERFAA